MLGEWQVQVPERTAVPSTRHQHTQEIAGIIIRGEPKLSCGVYSLCRQRQQVAGMEPPAAGAAGFSAWQLVATSTTPTLIVCILGAVGATLAHKVSSGCAAAAHKCVAFSVAYWQACRRPLLRCSFLLRAGHPQCPGLPDRGKNLLLRVHTSVDLFQAGPGRQPAVHPALLAAAGQHNHQVLAPWPESCAPVARCRAAPA